MAKKSLHNHDPIEAIKEESDLKRRIRTVALMLRNDELETHMASTILETLADDSAPSRINTSSGRD